MIIELETIGLHNPTRVKCNDRVLETQGLSIKDLCDLWKWYYRCPPFDKIYLVTNEDRLYMSLRQRTFASQKSIVELFAEQSVYVKKRSEINMENKKIYTANELFNYYIWDIVVDSKRIYPRAFPIFNEIKGEDFWYIGNDKELQNYADEVRDLFLDKVNNDFGIHQGILEIIKEKCRDAEDFIAKSIEYKLHDAIDGPYKTMLMAIEYYVIK